MTIKFLEDICKVGVLDDNVKFRRVTIVRDKKRRRRKAKNAVR
jgi:hypothetical protein